MCSGPTSGQRCTSCSCSNEAGRRNATVASLPRPSSRHWSNRAERTPRTRGRHMDLTGQAVIVTGSSSGIGAAVARRVDALGAGVVVNSSSSREAGEKVAGELRDAVYVQGDIGDPATAENLVRAATD